MKTIITIGRQYGSAGHQIGKALADELGIPYYDKELLERAAKDSGMCEELFENHDENRRTVSCTRWLWIPILSDMRQVHWLICR